MLLPICEECYKKFIATKDRNNIYFPYQEPGTSVKEYHKLFQTYLLGSGCHDIATERKNILFVYGLSDENKKEVERFLSLYNIRLVDRNFIAELVCHLVYIEELDNLFGRNDAVPREKSYIPIPMQESGMSVKEYFELFKGYLACMSIAINSEPARDLFIRGLSKENKEEVKGFDGIILNRPVDVLYISDLVCHLSSIEDLKDAIFGKKDKAHN